ncbi:hypothetical protein PVAG01_07151 [Phlyctema vagabunda]|uniref:ER-bound oxygenase mpaB/mpaB'/Rubber oxygenase catalytic domain-containing protein n=1 Tax=Phlyctema vagabunda TaxID=108571 RepID=A0ABR4PBL2_9HELO
MANITQAVPETASSSSSPRGTYIILGLLCYVSLCSFLRLRRRDAMEKKFGYTDLASLASMTNADAQKIMSYLAELEFPKVYLTSLQFALFKTYGIPTISGLLTATKEFSTPENASKRYADTTILIGEFSSHDPKSERVIKAIARMNFIHSQYQRSGKISNADLLYTLSVFITEPITWVEKFEWRSLTAMEKCAIGTFWKAIGDDMGISYHELENHKKGWLNGLEFYHDISAWAQAYEKQYMVPAQSNKQTADELVPLLLFFVPKAAQPAAANVVGVLMGDRLRKAMIYPQPPPAYFTVANIIFGTRKFVLRYLALPRASFMRFRQVSDQPDKKTGRYHWSTYQAHPYYNKPSFLNRWGPMGLFVWLMGGDVPGSKGDKYIPEGYTFEEVGPRGLKKRGGEQTREIEERLRLERPSGCPFAVSR